jgi:hypothetical protein
MLASRILEPNSGNHLCLDAPACAADRPPGQAGKQPLVTQKRVSVLSNVLRMSSDPLHVGLLALRCVVGWLRARPLLLLVLVALLESSTFWSASGFLVWRALLGFPGFGVASSIYLLVKAPGFRAAASVVNALPRHGSGHFAASDPTSPQRKQHKNTSPGRLEQITSTLWRQEVCGSPRQA